MGVNFVENNKKMTDNELIELINLGEYENFKIIIDRYLPLIAKYAKKYCPKNEFDDAVQEATFALYGAIKSYDSSLSSFAVFANLCIKRAVIAHLRKNNTQKTIPEELISYIEDIEVPITETPESIFIEKENYNALAESIKLELSKLEYNVLQNFLAGKSYKEIALSLSITEKSVDNALARIRKKIAAI